MKNTPLIALLVALPVVAGVYFITSADSDEPQIIIGKEPLADLAVEKIASIQVTALDSTDNNKLSVLKLTRGDKGWEVGNGRNYPADTDRVERFVKEFTEMKVLREVTASANQLERIQLAEPSAGKTNSATRISLLDADGKPVRTILLGKSIAAPSDGQENQSVFGGGSFPDRRFVMIDGERSSIAVVDQTFSNAETDPAKWLNKDFFKVEKPNAITVKFPGTNATNSWSIAERDDNGTAKWMFTDTDTNSTEKLDANKAPTTPFSSPSFDDIATTVPPGALDANATRATISNSDGFTYTLAISPKTPEDKYIIKLAVSGKFPEQRLAGKDETPEDKKRLDAEWKTAQDALKATLAGQQKFTAKAYVVPAYTVDPILKKRSELLPDSGGPSTPPGPLPPLNNFPLNPPKPQN